MAENAGDKTWAAVAQEAEARGGGTSNADLKAYAQTAGSVGGAAACAATGVGAAAVAACGVVGGIIGGAIVDIGVALFGSDAPNINDVWNPKLDSIMHKLSAGFPTVPWDDVKLVFAQAVDAATILRRESWKTSSDVLQKYAADTMGSRVWVYADASKSYPIGYIDEGTLSYFWTKAESFSPVAADIGAFGHDVVVGSTNAATVLAQRSASGGKSSGGGGGSSGGGGVVKTAVIGGGVLTAAFFAARHWGWLAKLKR